MIMCRVKNKDGISRSIERFNEKGLVLASQLIEKGGDFYFKVAKRVPISKVLP